MSSGTTDAKGKTQRASTASRGRSDSPPPYRSTEQTSIEDFANEFWQHAMNVAEHHPDDFKHQALPLARIKKVAKMDPELQNQMISSEVTVLFEKACQIFIQELTARAHLRSLAARRRMISRGDVAAAVSRSDMFDFLIDIVPRAERSPEPSEAGAPAQAADPAAYDAGPSAADTTAGYPDPAAEPFASSSSSAAPGRPTRSSRSRRYSERGSDQEAAAASGPSASTDLNDKRPRVDHSFPVGGGVIGSHAPNGAEVPPPSLPIPPGSAPIEPDGVGPAEPIDAQSLRQAFATGVLPAGLYMPELDAGAHQIPWAAQFGYPSEGGEGQPMPDFYAQGLPPGEPLPGMPLGEGQLEQAQQNQHERPPPQP